MYCPSVKKWKWNQKKTITYNVCVCFCINIYNLCKLRQIVDQFVCAWKPKGVFQPPLYDIFKKRFDEEVSLTCCAVFLFSYLNVTISSTWLETVAQMAEHLFLNKFTLFPDQQSTEMKKGKGKSSPYRRKSDHHP